jgi:hypothetical protein
MLAPPGYRLDAVWAQSLVLAVAPMLREVRAMGLTWWDLASSVTVLVMVLAYWSFQYRSGLPLSPAPGPPAPWNLRWGASAP